MLWLCCSVLYSIYNMCCCDACLFWDAVRCADVGADNITCSVSAISNADILCCIVAVLFVLLHWWFAAVVLCCDSIFPMYCILCWSVLLYCCKVVVILRNNIIFICSVLLQYTCCILCCFDEMLCTGVLRMCSDALVLCRFDVSFGSHKIKRSKKYGTNYTDRFKFKVPDVFHPCSHRFILL
jgi:hypothetical protein